MGEGWDEPVQGEARVASALASAYGLIAVIWNVAGLIGPSLAAALLAIFIPLGVRRYRSMSR